MGLSGIQVSQHSFDGSLSKDVAMHYNHPQSNQSLGLAKLFVMHKILCTRYLLDAI